MRNKMVTLMGVCCAVVFFVLSLIVYRSVRCKRELRGLHAGSQLARTDRGEVEYARIGEGPVVLSLHGGLGGWDQGIVIAERWLELAEHGFTVVAPSRPGYLRTPVEVGRTPEGAADAVAALLDALDIDKALVLGTSGGGPTALQLALRHPGRTQALVMFSAISGQHAQPGRTKKRYGWFLFSRYSAWLLDIGWWIVNGMVKRFPRLMIKSMFKATATKAFKVDEAVDHVMSHPRALGCINDLMQTQVPLSGRKAGLDNDLAVFADLSVYPLEQITCPTLVVHGRHDGNVPFTHAEFVANTVARAEMYVVEDAGHLACAGPGAARMRSAIIGFLKEHAGQGTGGVSPDPD